MICVSDQWLNYVTRPNHFAYDILLSAVIYASHSLPLPLPFSLSLSILSCCVCCCCCPTFIFAIFSQLQCDCFSCAKYISSQSSFDHSVKSFNCHAWAHTRFLFHRITIEVWFEFARLFRAGHIIKSLLNSNTKEKNNHHNSLLCPHLFIYCMLFVLIQLIPIFVLGSANLLHACLHTLVSVCIPWARNPPYHYNLAVASLAHFVCPFVRVLLLLVCVIYLQCV